MHVLIWASLVISACFNDIFNGQGLTDSRRTISNMDGVDKLIEALQEDFTGLTFTNLVDFDAVYGHRRNPEGYAEALEAFDKRLPEIYQHLGEDDLLILTADHGNDPTYPGTDHTREYVPLLIFSPQFKKPGELNATFFSDIAATISENFAVKQTENGTTFLNQLI